MKCCKCSISLAFKFFLGIFLAWEYTGPLKPAPLGKPQSARQFLNERKSVQIIHQSTNRIKLSQITRTLSLFVILNEMEIHPDLESATSPSDLMYKIGECNKLSDEWLHRIRNSSHSSDIKCVIAIAIT